MTGSEGSLVGIVIPTTRDAGRLRACVAALERGAAGVPHEVVLVLNGADDSVVAAAPGLRARVVFSPANLGFGGACNLGVECGPDAEFVALLHDDARVSGGWLAALVAAARRRPAAGLIGSVGAALFRDGTTAVLDLEHEAAVDYCSSCALIVRRAAWEASGGMDEALFPAGYGDVALALRVRRAGWEVRCEPRAQVEHAAMGSLPAGYRAWLHGRSRERFLRTWAAELSDYEPPGAGAVERALARAADRPCSPAAVARAPRRSESGDERAWRFARLELALQREYLTVQEEALQAAREETARVSEALQAAREETARVSEALHEELRRVHTRAAVEIEGRERELQRLRAAPP